MRCLRCDRTFMAGSIDYVCPCRPNQGSDLGHLDAVYDYDAIEAMRKASLETADSGLSSLFPPQFRYTGRTIERWWPLLPVRPASLPPLPVGDTPLLRASRLGEALRVPKLYLKDDGRNPSGSFKDRASAVAVARARETDREVVATASTGNAAAALAAMSAAAAHSAVIFVPRSAPQAKIAQLLVYGSRVLAVDGTYDDAFDLCVRACDEFGWYNRNTGYNPFMTEGKKTVSFEIATQLAEANARDGLKGSEGHSRPLVVPDCVFVSVGDGSIIGGVYKGFWELHTLGWVDRIPRIFGIQSAASAAIHDAWRDDLDLPQPVAAATAADSISVNAPRDATKALRAVRASGGAFLLVEDEAIFKAILPLARLGGVFAEPAGATALAGLQLAQRKGLLEPDETVVVISTGSGLKDVPAAMRVAGEPSIIPPTLEAVAENLDN
ncbi:MAG: threonine synthase [Caldilineaceae bacterium SB0675_bin_29]|uniref:Threonine synthase n=1 Tax=Caldilineaceae bacterium SB0675_bin_29 TaxID=2605266 RepID=A0A6B1G390_9CHLR|nr:threonine synthase [Caldilineaceae bacterium SB0675_bin_29]